ncbi:MAG: hypothetical protein DRJ05_13550 [Bacteroidetes bacterium]|nr:MAG: hypothetical protein DRJ05_13550 [Bacteroidota bacterium]
MKKYKLFAGLALILLAVSYFTPIWWVALKSIQYPESMYPDGIRVEFKYNGVYNGCVGREREELAASQAGADCLVEMNAINHFIGMYRITQGRNSDKTRDYPVYYVFDTEKDANGDDIINQETGNPIKIDVTPNFLKGLDGVMIYSPYFFIIFFILGLVFIFTPKKVNMVFALIPALLPFYFLIGYMIGLYWYGHHLGLHGGGAFEGINEFMPTVFGEGKVAQFVTMSYPYLGFFITLAVFFLLLFAILVKRKELKEIKA